MCFPELQSRMSLPKHYNKRTFRFKPKVLKFEVIISRNSLLPFFLLFYTGLPGENDSQQGVLPQPPPPRTRESLKQCGSISVDTMSKEILLALSTPQMAIT